MINKPIITRWQKNSPWKEFYQIEQDLVISRILIEIFSDDFLRNHLAFRGGTALHKLYLHPAPRYSEDIDLVQIKSGPVGSIMKRLDEIINFFEIPRSTQIKGHSAKLYYRFYSEYEHIPLRLKIEINLQEHFKVLNWVFIPFSVETEWFSGQAFIRTYNINELLATKLRALYQRSKGRDLFDLDYARRHININTDDILKCYFEYMLHSNKSKIPGKTVFLKNIEKKINDPLFIGDLEGLLRPGINYDPMLAYEWLKNEIIDKM